MKAYIKNSINNREYQVERASLDELNAFIDYQKNKQQCPWGALEEVLLCDPDNYPERAEFVEEVSRQEPMFDESFNPILIEVVADDGEGNQIVTQEQAFQLILKHKVRIPQEFSIVIDELPSDMKPHHLVSMHEEIEHMLDKTDWLFVSDVVIDPSWRVMFKNYRQLLRDFHGRPIESFSNEESFKVESFSNYMRRVQPQEFLDGGEGSEIIKKFNAKLK